MLSEYHRWRGSQEHMPTAAASKIAWQKLPQHDQSDLADLSKGETARLQFFPDPNIHSQSRACASECTVCPPARADAAVSRARPDRSDCVRQRCGRSV